jgi:hypothetical protein
MWMADAAYHHSLLVFNLFSFLQDCREPAFYRELCNPHSIGNEDTAQQKADSG